jgi:hypothetical protein
MLKEKSRTQFGTEDFLIRKSCLNQKIIGKRLLKPAVLSVTLIKKLKNIQIFIQHILKILNRRMQTYNKIKYKQVCMPNIDLRPKL